MLSFLWASNVISRVAPERFDLVVRDKPETDLLKPLRTPEASLKYAGPARLQKAHRIDIDLKLDPGGRLRRPAEPATQPGR
jgi:hypothetical protein